MRGLAGLTAIATLAGCAMSAAMPIVPRRDPSQEASDGMRTVNFCEHVYPWPRGPLTEVTLHACKATYQETPAGRPEDASAWTWKVDDVRFSNGGNLAEVKLRMRETIGRQLATYSRTYRYRWDGHAVVLVAIDEPVRVFTDKDLEFTRPE